MSRRQIFHLFYYSQLPLILMAAVLTASISSVLFSEIYWESLLLVGVSTFLTYSLDNLIDWPKDRTHYASISPAVRIYHRALYGLIPISAVIVIFLILRSPADLRIGILLLGAAVVMGVSRFSFYRDDPQNDVRPFIINRIFITTVWTIVCIFVPIWYGHVPPFGKTARTFVYMLMLIGVYAVLWKFEKSTYLLKKRLIHSRLFSVLALMTVLAMGLVVYDVLVGTYLPFHLITLLPPLIELIALVYIVNSPILIREKISLLTVIMMVITSVTATLHLIF